MNQYPKLSDQMNQQLLEAREYKLQLWTEYVLFDWHWWLGVILTIGPILVWIMFHKRNERKSLLLAGLTTAILAAAIDTSGQFFGWYDYRYDVPHGSELRSLGLCVNSYFSDVYHSVIQEY
ncbi:hypothetical protein [Piscibacillus salipiscarius]|uniref:hypothetical protein n=1 Tax=Piscibacillus salipiscarius TaxID=299480 RepID=UPI0006D0DF7B|nr:hypothetical protein [Piscibacillus salipiscarius]